MRWGSLEINVSFKRFLRSYTLSDVGSANARCISRLGDSPGTTLHYVLAATCKYGNTMMYR